MVPPLRLRHRHHQRAQRVLLRFSVVHNRTHSTVLAHAAFRLYHLNLSIEALPFVTPYFISRQIRSH